MTKPLTEVRKFNCNSKNPWVVDIRTADYRNGYVMPDGTTGTAKESWGFYDTREDAEAAEALYLAKNVGKDNGIETSAERKQTNPKDVIGMKKAPISTLSGPVLFEMGLGMLEGARKYGRHNYRAMGTSATVYYDAAIGHLVDWFEGEDLDPDTGLSHVTKAMTALLVLRDSMLMGNWMDDRPLRNPNKLYKKSFNPKAKEIIERYPDAVEPYTEANKELDRTKPVSGGY